MGHVIHLHRLRHAIRVLLIPTGDPARITDPTWLRQADTALTTIAALHDSLPPSRRAPLATLIDGHADPAARHQALLDAADQLRVSAPRADPDDEGDRARVVHRTSRRVAYAQGRLFDPGVGPQRPSSRSAPSPQSGHRPPPLPDRGVDRSRVPIDSIEPAAAASLFEAGDLEASARVLEERELPEAFALLFGM
jgi:hypothetical protein